MNAERTRNIPDIVLERYHLKELPPEEMNRVTALLEHDEALRDRLRALETSDRVIRNTVELDRIINGIHDRARPSGSPRSPSRPAIFFTVPAIAALAIVLAVVLLPRDRSAPPSGGPADAGDRIKGLTPSLTVYRRIGDRSETLADGAVARKGDVIRVAYHSAGRAFGAILSVDGRGTVTVHLPTNADSAAALQHDTTVLLEQAYELDDAPLWERFYFVTSDTPFAVPPVADVIRKVATVDGSTPAAAVALPPGLELATFALQKENRP